MNTKTDTKWVVGQEADLPVLSETERRCLQSIAEGNRLEQIASQVGLSRDDIAAALDTARIKLNCNNLLQAVAHALSTGLIDDDLHIRNR